MTDYDALGTRGVAVATLAVVAGSALPWVRKAPAGYSDGEPYYTDELVWGLTAGFELSDALVVVPALSALAVYLAVADRDRVVNGWGIVCALPVLWFAGRRFETYWTGETYAVEPGLGLVLVGGILLVLIGAFGIVRTDRTQ